MTSDPRAALEALLDSCDGCGCLGETHAHRAEQALRRVLDLEAPQRHPDTNPAVHKLFAVGWADAMQAVREAITTALEGKQP